MKSETQSRYEEARDRARKWLGRFKGDIDKYEARSDHSTDAVRIRRESYEAMLAMIEEANDAIAKMGAEAARREREAFEAGRKQVQAQWDAAADLERATAPTVEELPPEVRRQESKRRAAETWPHLYATWTEDMHELELQRNIDGGPMVARNPDTRAIDRIRDRLSNQQDT